MKSMFLSKAVPMLLQKGRRVMDVAIVLALVCFAPSVTLGEVQGSGPPPLDKLVNNVKQSVVNLSSTRVIETSGLLGPGSKLREYFGEEFFEQFFGQIPSELKTESLGTGLLIDNEGHILTNNHVIEDATQIKVTLQNEKIYDAEVIGKDPKTELALIKIKGEAELPPPAVLGDSDVMDVGDWVIAVGNPFGLGHTVTQGIISAKGRVIGAGPYDDFLQTDAAINPGNSGGPLFNMRGEVIGINTAITAQGQGIGFAIPINIAKELLPQLKEGKVIRGWLGIVIQSITPELAQYFQLQQPKGVIIAQVLPDSPAAASGLMQGDLILSLNGQQIEDANTFSRMVADLKPGVQVNLGIMRSGKQMTQTVTLGEMPEETKEAPAQPSPEDHGKMGFSVQSLSPQLSQALGLEENETGVIVAEVRQGSPADDAGLKVGDLIQQANGQPVSNAQEFREILRSRQNHALLLLVKRGEHGFYAVVQPQE